MQVNREKVVCLCANEWLAASHDVFVFDSISTIQNRASFCTGIMRRSHTILSLLMATLRDRLRTCQQSRLLLTTTALKTSQMLKRSQIQQLLLLRHCQMTKLKKRKLCTPRKLWKYVVVEVIYTMLPKKCHCNLNKNSPIPVVFDTLESSKDGFIFLLHLFSTGNFQTLKIMNLKLLIIPRTIARFIADAKVVYISVYLQLIEHSSLGDKGKNGPNSIIHTIETLYGKQLFA